MQKMDATAGISREATKHMIKIHYVYVNSQPACPRVSLKATASYEGFTAEDAALLV